MMYGFTRLGLLRAIQATVLLFLCACSSTGVLKPSESAAKPPPNPSPHNPSLHDSRAFAQALALFGTGISAQINGEYALALTNYLNAIVLDPTHEELYIRAAVVHLQLNEPDKAIALIQRLCELKPDSAQACIWYGLMCNAADLRKESYIAFRKAIQLDPLGPDAYKELAANYVRDDEAERAILILERGAQQSSDPGGLLHFLGQLYIHKSNLCRDPGMASEYRSTARQTLERARDITPDDDEILAQLGDLYIVDRQYEEAAAVLQRLTELQPDNIPLKKKLSLVYGALKQEDKAAEVLEEISRKIAFHPKAYYYLGELYEKMGEKEKAILNFRLATQIDPPDAAPFLHLALLNLETNPEEAIGYLHDGLLKLPDDPRLTEILAYLYMKQGDYA
ncbi:MAG: tetratricopeptide repeat protein, partial [Kiritimatiellae bacterium]|nr:tetratricopeptide repeat protein [Kiritimatiellia bacterium]